MTRPSAFVVSLSPTFQPRQSCFSTTVCSLDSPQLSKTNTKQGAIIVGAGISGLAAAKELADAAIPVTILEADSDIGGRIRTDEVNGFVLDRGFQVFIEAYPQCRQMCVWLQRILSDMLFHCRKDFTECLTIC